jgi:hypothetical protein
MMKVFSKKNHVLLSLDRPEAEFFVRIFCSLIGEYQTEPAQTHEKLADVWYPSLSLQVGNMSNQEIEDWNDQLFELRGERCASLEKWSSFLEAAKKFPVEWQISIAEAETLLMIFNDYRLATAAKHGLDDSELEHDFESVQDPQKKLALFEVHFLAWIMERVIDELANHA